MLWWTIIQLILVGTYGELNEVNGTSAVYVAEKIMDLLDTIATDDILQTMLNVDEISCTRLCGRSDDCVSFFYSHETNSCQLHRGRFCNIPVTAFSTASTYQLYIMRERQRFPLDCYDILLDGHTNSGVYTIFVAGNPKEVYCDQVTDGGGWLVFQRRKDGSVDFYRGWNEYENGFGNITHEFWIGNDVLTKITFQRMYTLRVDLESFENETRFAFYDTFKLDDASTNYTLHVDGYDGTAGDSLKRGNGHEFSTKDRDNDIAAVNCATKFTGAWWYEKCHRANLNGFYHGGYHGSYADGINWFHWKGYYYSLKTTEMKLRPKH